MTVHCLGNGRICVYGRGAEVLQAFGPEYSSPTAFSMTAELADVKTRKLSHIAFSHVSPEAELLDFLPKGADLFVRADPNAREQRGYRYRPERLGQC